MERATPSVLRKRHEFLDVSASTTKWVSPRLIMIVKQLTLQSTPNCLRYGLTASRKIGGAVERNRARRRMRTLVREILCEHARTDHVYVLIARTTTGECGYPQLRDDVVMGLKRLRLWRD